MNTFLILFCCTIIAVGAHFPNHGHRKLKSKDERVMTYEAPCICPAEHIIETDECVLNSMKRRYIKNIWSNPAMALEGAQVQMKNVLLKMSEVEYPLWRQAAFVNNVWLSNYLPSVNEKPSLCAFAQMINATVAWETSKDRKALSDALNEIAASLYHYVMAAGDNAIKAAGCNVSTPNMFRDQTCYKNGLVYDIDQVWDISGGMMPIAYGKATKALYKSNSYIDNLIAIMATGSITKPLQEISTEFQGSLVSQFLHLENTKPIPTCCCESFIKNLINSYDLFKVEAVKIANGIKQRMYSTAKKN